MFIDKYKKIFIYNKYVFMVVKDVNLFLDIMDLVFCLLDKKK